MITMRERGGIQLKNPLAARRWFLRIKEREAIKTIKALI
jgi:hypothetical protein